LAPGEQLPYPKLADRVKARADGNEHVAKRVSTFDRETLLSRLSAEGIPGAPVQTLDEFLEDTSLEPAGVVSPLQLTENHQTLLAGKLAGGNIATVTPKPAPKIGEQTSSILKEVGSDGDAMAELINRKIIFLPKRII